MINLLFAASVTTNFIVPEVVLPNINTPKLQEVKSMGALLEKVIERSIKGNYIDQNEANNLRKVFQESQAKYQIPEEWVIKMILMETNEGAFNGRAGANGRCKGIVQVCVRESTLDDRGIIRNLGGYGKWLDTPPSQQLSIWFKGHYEYWLKIAGKAPTSAGEFYVMNLYPASFINIAKGRANRDTQVTAGKQAHILFDNYNEATKSKPPGGKITVNSIERGLNIKVKQLFGDGLSGPTSANPTGPDGTSGQAGNYSSPTGALPNLVADSALLKGENCPPPPYTQQDRIIYTGCSPKINSVVPSGGNSLGYPAPAVGTVNGTPGSTSTSTYKYDGPLSPGGFIMPAKGTITSKWGMRWGKMHRGWDIANGVGTPIVAMANGVVTGTVTGCPPSRGVGDSCGKGYGNQIIIDHGGSMSTMSAHLSEVLVREGQQVKQGELIGKMGSTGSSTGSHVHTEIRRNGSAEDPAKYLKG